MPGHVKYEFRNADVGDVVRVDVDATVNVMLMDEESYTAYSAGKAFRYLGGQVKKSPVMFSIPAAGNWFIAIDNGTGERQRFRHMAVITKRKTAK